MPEPFPLAVEQATGRPRLAVNTGTCGRALCSDALVRSLRELAGERYEISEAGCDGACFEAPTVRALIPDRAPRRFSNVAPGDARHLLAEVDAISDVPAPATESVFFAGQSRSLLARCGVVNPTDIDSALALGAYRGLWRALSSLTPDQVIDEVEAAELRGRGGAYFPAGRKWRSAGGFPAPRYVAVNAEEGEPGVFKDRHLMEGDPHLLLEGVLIAAYAVGAERAFIFINGLAHGSRRVLEQALAQAYDRGLAGSRILGSDYSVEIEIRAGAGGYVLGEESVLLNGIEGWRSVPRTRPPFPTEAGLWASPTVINNVETLCNVPGILREGVEAYRSGAGPNGTGTKLVSLSGAVKRPGLVEIAMGTSLKDVIFEIGGGAQDGRAILGVLAGGPSGGFLAGSSLDTPARPGPLTSSGAVLGSGGMVVLDETFPIVELVRHLTEYNRNESCGKCTPCREGTDQMLEILSRAASFGAAPADLDRLLFLGEVATSASLCGLGQMAPNPITSAVDQFGDQIRSAFTGRSP
jgi:NADH:ubiquinone oxidoreductase subunit F (NADH-binding)